MRLLRDRNRQSERLSRQGVAWVDRMKSGQMTLAEGEELRRWCQQSPEHREALNEAVSLLQLVREAGRDLTDLDAAAIAREATLKRQSRPLNRRAFLRGAVASACAGGAAYLALDPPLRLWPSLQQIAADLQADYRTDTGERRRLTLARASIELNTQTGVAVLTAASGAGIRLIHGEAAVSIEGAPFVVQAGAGHIAATRAKFDVRLEDSSVCVTCADGELQVLHPLKAVTVSSGQQLRYTDSDAGRVVHSDTAIVTSWQRGMLIFHDEPLGQVIEEINRYRKGRIVLLNQGIARRSVYATIQLDALDSVIEQVQRFSGARVMHVGRLVLLS